MDPLTLAAVGLGVGGLATSAWNAFEQSKTRDTEVELANTAHQREVGDLRAAGLNPLLSVNRGANTPSLPSPQMDISGPANSALSALTAKSQIALMGAQTNSAQASADNTNVDTATKQQTQEFAIQQQRLAVINSGLDRETKNKQLNLLDEQLQSLKSNNLLLRYQLPGAYNQAKFDKSKVGQYAPYYNSAFDVAHKLKSVIGR